MVTHPLPMMVFSAAMAAAAAAGAIRLSAPKADRAVQDLKSSQEQSRAALARLAHAVGSSPETPRPTPGEGPQRGRSIEQGR